MANGVPETDVFKAADAVLASGERATVERVRTELGRGSPARVGHLLEQWWEQLAQRLKGQALLPELPVKVAQAFANTWRMALEHAGTAAHQALVEQHNDLFARETSLTQERKLWEIALAEAQADRTYSVTKLVQAEIQLLERQNLVDQLIAEVADVRQQRDHLQAHVQRRQVEFDALRAEHSSTLAHIRVMEDRTRRHVDQARQEIKALWQDKEKSGREHAKQLAELTGQRDALQVAIKTAEQNVAHQAGRVAALESTVRQWRGGQIARPKHAARKSIAGSTPKSPLPRKKTAT